MILSIATWVAGAFLAAGAILAIVRLARGPSILDRMLAVDVLLVIIICALCIDMAVNHHLDHLVFIVVAGVVGFLGSVTVARYVVDRRGV
jgi:multicomponent Na+:H+ antiporter subunit F